MNRNLLLALFGVAGGALAIWLLTRGAGAGLGLQAVGTPVIM